MPWAPCHLRIFLRMRIARVAWGLLAPVVALLYYLSVRVSSTLMIRSAAAAACCRPSKGAGCHVGARGSSKDGGASRTVWSGWHGGAEWLTAV